MAVKTLTDLANFHGTDKGTNGPSASWGGHHYTEVYEAYLERLRFAEINILEIGLGVLGDRWDSQIVHGRNCGGASVKMWYDYFPNARVYGIDINPCAYLDNDRIRTFVADQGSTDDLAAFIAAVGGIEFDFIVDDGSHRPDHQQISLGFFFRHLRRGGLYFIEDLWRTGRGDGATGRHVCEDVLNTRRVLKHFREYGEFLKPNAIVKPDYLAAHIEYLNFHVPERFARVRYRASLRRPLKKTVHIKPESELLCAIQKK